MNTPTVNLDPGDAIELGELLGYLAERIDSHRDNLAASHRLFLYGPYPPEELRSDLLRFAVMVGVNDGGQR